MDAKSRANHGVAPFWFWNDEIADAEATRQMELMREAGVKQFMIHARNGLQNEYMGDDWFLRIENCIAQAKRLGMQIWLYDEKDWPSGNFSHTLTKEERLREHFLVVESIKAERGEGLSLPQGKDILSIRSCPGGVDLLGEESFVPKEDGEAHIVRACVNGYEPYGKFCIDYMSKEAIRRFIETTHEKYAERFGEEFGKTIVGIFVDETRFFNALPWTEEFPQAFAGLKKYDIVPLLHLLAVDGDHCKEVRRDYYDVIAHMMGEATFRQLYDWCDSHDLLLTGHFLGEETLASQTRFNGDMLRHFKYFHIPGIDHLGNGTGSLEAKFCACAAQNYGKDRIGCEAFGACGWDIGFEEMVKMSNWLFQQGVNLIIPHAFYYSIRGERKDDWPPSYFFQWEDWGRYPEYARMAEGMGFYLSGGAPEADVLVYYPVEAYSGHIKPDFAERTCYFKDGPRIRDGQAAKIDRGFQLLCSELMDRNIGFGILNADATCNFVVEGGKIINTLNGSEYSILVFPEEEALPQEAVLLAGALMEQGGLVILIDGTEREGRIADRIKALAREPFEIVRGTDRLHRTQMHYPDRIHDPYLHDGEQQYGIGVSSYLKKGLRVINITNYNDSDEKLLINVLSNGKPRLYETETCEAIDPECVPQENGVFGVSLTVPRNRARFILCTP